jgi:hypothetical protein
MDSAADKCSASLASVTLADAESTAARNRDPDPDRCCKYCCCVSRKELLLDDTKTRNLVGKKGRNIYFLRGFLGSCLKIFVPEHVIDVDEGISEVALTRVQLQFCSRTPETEAEIGRSIKAATRGGILKIIDNDQLDNVLTKEAKYDLFESLDKIAEDCQVDILKLKSIGEDKVTIFVRETRTSTPRALEKAIKLAGMAIHRRFRRSQNGADRGDTRTQIHSKREKMKGAGICLSFAQNGRCGRGGKCKFFHST